MSEPQVIDYTIVNDLIEVDDVNFYVDLLNGCFKQLEEERENLVKAADTGDVGLFNSRSHFLKGSCASVGLVYLQELFQDMQYYHPSPGEDPKKRMQEYLTEVARRERTTIEYIRTNTSWNL